MAEPIAEDEDHKAADCGKTEIERAQREKHPSPPQADHMARPKTDHTQAEIQEQSPEASAAQDVIARAVRQCDQ